jgi:hypothetical protein
VFPVLPPRPSQPPCRGPRMSLRLLACYDGTAVRVRGGCSAMDVFDDPNRESGDVEALVCFRRHVDTDPCSNGIADVCQSEMTKKTVTCGEDSGGAAGEQPHSLGMTEFPAAGRPVAVEPVWDAWACWPASDERSGRGRLDDEGDGVSRP